MKIMSIFPISILAFLAITACAASMPAAIHDHSDTKAVAEGNTTFALTLYEKLKETEGNLFFSPYSISTALAMTYAGARNNTEKQMGEVLHFTVGERQLHPAFAHLEAQLNAVQEKGNIELDVANALWVQNDYTFLKNYLDATEKHYGAVLNHVDFKKAHESARRKINAWVEDNNAWKSEAGCKC